MGTLHHDVRVLSLQETHQSLQLSPEGENGTCRCGIRSEDKRTSATQSNQYTVRIGVVYSISRCPCVLFIIYIMNNLIQSLAKQGRFRSQVMRDGSRSRDASSLNATTHSRERITNYASYNYMHVTRSTQYQFLIFLSYEMHIIIILTLFASTRNFNKICYYMAYIILGGNNSIRFHEPTYYLLVLLNISYHTNNSFSCE